MSWCAQQKPCQNLTNAALLAAQDERPAHQEADTPVWMYPSEQMFYNAMKRKGWSPSEQDMESVVAIHNGVNERAWSEVTSLELLP